MQRLGVLAALAFALSVGDLASARGDKYLAKHSYGVIISATPKADGGTFDLKVAFDVEGEKTLELPAELIVVCEKGDQKKARTVRAKDKKPLELEDPAKSLIAKGTLTKAVVQGTDLLLTLKSDDATEQQFSMPTRRLIVYTPEGEKLTVGHLMPAPRYPSSPKGRGKPPG